MVTHEAEMAAYAGRRIHFIDGVIDNGQDTERKTA
jgi:ABC-type lipoprotein export system ATPase subunit